MTPAVECAPKKMFLDIPNAAELAGFSVRHFRRIIEEERIRIVQIGRKFFILGTDFEKWQATNRRNHVDTSKATLLNVAQ